MHKVICKYCQKEFEANLPVKQCDECKNKKHFCLCGCGEEIIGCTIKYISGHGNRGRKRSEEFKQKVSKSKMGIGHPVSNETKQKISIANTGINNGMFGKTQSEEAKNLIKQTSKERWEDSNYRKNCINSMINSFSNNKKELYSIQVKERWNDENYKIIISKKIKDSLNTPEMKKLLSIRMKEQWKNPIFLNKMNTPEMKQIRRENAIKSIRTMIKNNSFKYCDTKPELEMEKILIELNIKYEKQKPIRNIEHMYPCDFFLPDTNTVLEVDGKYWHNYPNYTEKDLIRNQELKKANYNVIRFWQDEFDINSVKERLLR